MSATIHTQHTSSPDAAGHAFWKTFTSVIRAEVQGTPRSRHPITPSYLGAKILYVTLLGWFIVTGSLASAALDPAKLPGQNFDLSHWKLQLPIKTPEDPTGVLSLHIGVDEIRYPSLATYTSSYFYTNSDGAMRFYAQTTGDTTSGSDNPRSELREIYSASANSWFNTYGTAILDGSLKVYQTPASTGKICIGQVHGDTDSVSTHYQNTLPLMMFYDDGKLWAEINYSPSVNNRFDILTTNIASSLPSSLITYRVVMVPGAMIVTLNGVTKVAVTDQTALTGWQNAPVYFKAGDYVQIGGNTTGQPAGDGGSTAFYSLNLTHITSSLSVSTASLPTGLASAPYSQTLQATSGSGSLTWSLPSAVIGNTDGTSTAAGSLPSGLSLSSSGVISGTPAVSTANKTYPNIVFQVTDASGAIAVKPISLSIGKIAATVSLGTLSATYDGRPKSATATTNPSGLAVSLTYDGDATPPINPGTYAVVATINDINYVGSASGSLTIAAPEYSGTYFGAFATGGNWALTVRRDNTASYLAYLPDRQSAISANFTVGTVGAFTVNGTEIKPAATAATGLALISPESPAPRTSAATAYTLTGQIAVNGNITGSLIGLGEAFTGAATGLTGPAQTVAGHYTANALGSASGNVYSIVGPTGQALFVNVTPTGVDAATGNVNSSDQFTTTTANNAKLSVFLNDQAQNLHASITPPGAVAPITYAGVPDTVTPNAYLSNLSVRAAMAAGQTLIVGFVVDGGAKPILVRAAGPSLSYMPEPGLVGVDDPKLMLYNTTNPNSPVLEAQNDNWDASVGATFRALGAFPFYSETSKDAALLQSISGPHTAQATATGPGVILVETYDAGPNDTRKLTNLSARFHVGTGDDILIAGFVVAGNGTCQVLVRAVGPTLTTYGVTGVLADPQLAVGSYLVRGESNNDWSSALSPTFTALGAFALNPGSKDAALLLTLTAGDVYTVQVSGVANTTGEALVEIYLLP